MCRRRIPGRGPSVSTDTGNGDVMNDAGLARIKYYEGQMLTVRDFNDQQEYHRQKQKDILKRFPHGIIGGLEVDCVKKGDDPTDFDGFLIKAGLAVDREGNQIVVPESGYKVPASEFDPNKPYLSLVYREVDGLVGNGLCGSSQKNNRVNEGFEVSWDKAPNIGPSVTVALVQLKEGETAGPTCDSYTVSEKDEAGGPRIRIDAGVVGSDQIADNAISETKIRNNAIKTDKIDNEAVTGIKIARRTITQNQIANKAINTDQIADKAVTAQQVVDKAFTRDQIADKTIIADQIADKAVTATQIADKTITVNQIADRTITKDQIADKTITKNQIVRKTITTDEIADKAVTSTQLADKTITSGEIADQTITRDQIGLKTITAGQIADTTITGDNLSLIGEGDDHTVSGGKSLDVPINGVSPNGIIQVIPTNPGGPISWTLTSVESRANKLLYMIRVKHEGATGSDPVGFRVRVIALGPAS
jgi:hypothetical protein